jgi:hypothetical protein
MTWKVWQGYVVKWVQNQQFDNCVYIKKNINKSYVIVCFYVDYILILDKNDHMIKSTKKILINKFDMKDLGVTDVILRIEISRTSNGLVLSPISLYWENSREVF